MTGICEPATATASLILYDALSCAAVMRRRYHVNRALHYATLHSYNTADSSSSALVEHTGNIVTAYCWLMYSMKVTELQLCLWPRFPCSNSAYPYGLASQIPCVGLPPTASFPSFSIRGNILGMGEMGVLRLDYVLIFTKYNDKKLSKKGDLGIRIN